eukprot:GHVR01178719.1.p1 GENE.GHVR01178719.1~~GHVR01178719.1.p1  ORF type:complete len:449 (+),score=51.59 GHVR01178719.1:645-1991(+)
MPLGWRLTMKEDSETGSRKPKARLYCQGFRDRRKELETYAGTPTLSSILVSIVFVLSKGWNLAKVDVKTAFLQAYETNIENVGTVIPEGLPVLPLRSPYEDVGPEEWEKLRRMAQQIKPGDVRILVKALYGLKTAPSLFGKRFTEVLKKLGFEPIDESVLVKRDHSTKEITSVLWKHVDDCQGGGINIEKELEDLGNMLATSGVIQLEEGKTAKFLGMEQKRIGAELEISQEAYLNSLNVADLISGRKRVVNSEDLAPPKEGEIDKSLQSKYAALNGVLGWAIKTRPDQRVYHDTLSCFITTPSARHLQALALVLQTLKQTPSTLKLQGLPGDVKLVLFTDASYERDTFEGRLGWKVFLVDVDWRVYNGSLTTNLVLWGTKRDKTKHGSSTSAELLALDKGIRSLWGVKRLVTQLWGQCIGVEIYIDCNPLCHQLQSGRCMEDPIYFN